MTSRILLFFLVFFISLSINAQIDRVFIIEIDKIEACQNLTTTFTTGFIVLPPAIGLDTLIVDFGDGNADTLLNPVYGQSHTHSYNTVGEYTISLIGLKDNLSKSATQVVHVFGLPDSDFTYANYGYPGVLDTFYFSNQRYVFAANDTNHVSHIWTVNSDTLQFFDDSLVYHFETIGAYHLTHAIEVNSCISSSSQVLNIKEQDLIIPNVFTPNNDGKNDLFYIQTDGNMEYEFTVHDRNGNRVYVSESKVISWDGVSYWGEVLNSGNYYYSLIPETGETRTGIIYLAR